MIQLNSLDHFEVIFNEESLSYEFTTDDTIKYIITFIDYAQVIEVQFPFYAFGIERYPENERSISNNKVRNTVIYILSKFFSNNQNALVAIYDSLDGKQMFRKRLFDRWYHLFNDGSVSKVEGCFNSCEEETYAIVIYSNRNNNIDIIKEKFNYLINQDFFNS